MRGIGLLLALLAAAGCTTGGRLPAAGISAPTVTATSEVTEAVAALPAEQVVIRVRTGDGYWSRPRAPFEIPSLVVTGDGAVYASPRTTGFVTPVVRVSRLAPTEVVELSAAALQTDDLLTADFGVSGWTDLETTTVSVHGTGPALTASVYGFGSGLEEGLTGAQVERREQLQELISQLDRLSIGTQEWVPDRVRVQRFWSYGPVIPGGAYPTWSGPDLATLPRNDAGSNDGCAEVTTGAADLYAAARANPDAIWATSEGQTRLAVVPLMPGETAC